MSRRHILIPILLLAAGTASAHDSEEHGVTPEAERERARELRIAPGGVVAVHRHEQRPGVAYILEGSIVEHRNDAAEPVVRGPGAVAFERSGITHWWESRGDTPVRALVVDVVPAPESRP